MIAWICFALMWQSALCSFCSYLAGVSPIERDLTDITNKKLKFDGFGDPVVSYIDSDTSKIVIKSYSEKPTLSVENGQLVISASASCDQEEVSASSASRFGSPSFLGMMAAAILTGRESPMLATCLGAASLATGVAAECTPAIEIEIHRPITTAEVDAAISKAASSGQYTSCPPETLKWTFPSTAHKGYSGCVGEAGMTPCEQDSFEGLAGATSLSKPYVFDESTGTCTATGNTMHNMTLWILWGLPMDTAELVKRTGTNPVVKFPLQRGTYPSYAWSDHGDDTESAQVSVKKFVEYLGAFTSTELEAFDVGFTEGAEAGQVELFAAMALHIAQTTCNRAIYILMEAPCYGYSTSRAAQLVNDHSSSFYTENCPDASNDPVTISAKGWVPGTTLPSAADAFGTSHGAASTDANSPWMESMVFPENPSGVRKVPHLPADRRICDGVYLFPMYFGANDWKIPMDLRPDCAAWSFSITKLYSATVRAGAVMYKKSPTGFASSVNSILKKVHNIADGIYSEWSWMGQMQIFDMMMEKPVSDPTSWIGAYSLIMKEKWDDVIEGFANCPVVEITNNYAGAYVWFKYRAPYLNLQTSFISSFFLEVLGIKTTTYYWGFRGANPADYYGTGYDNYDFTRMQLYRDVNVYKEVARRAQIACGGGTVEGYKSIAEWKASAEAAKAGGRRLGTSLEEKVQDLKKTVPRFTDAEAKNMAYLQHTADGIHNNIEKNCADEGYTTSCLFEHAGTKPKDLKFGHAY